MCETCDLGDLPRRAGTARPTISYHSRLILGINGLARGQVVAPFAHGPKQIETSDCRRRAGGTAARHSKPLTDPRSRDRVQAVQLATTGQHTHEQIAELVGRARSTIQRWIDRYEAGGLRRLLERKQAPVRRVRCRSRRYRRRYRRGSSEGLGVRRGNWPFWLEQTHGIRRAANSLYYWLGKSGGRSRCRARRTSNKTRRPGGVSSAPVG